MIHSPPSRPARVLLLALTASASLSACATGKKVAPDVVWPLPPETPRVKYVRSFSNEEDLGKGVLSQIGRAFLPSDGGLAIAQPTGMALSPDEKTLYVSCNAPQRIIAVDLEHQKMRRIASSGENRPNGPFGVATDAEGNVYVSDHGRSVVWVYAPDGSFLRKFGAEKLERPTGIAIDRRRQVVYVTSGVSSASKHHRIEVFSLKGQHLRTIGTRGVQPGEFNFPANLGISRDGQLYVVDMLNFRIQIFDPDGQLVSMFGVAGAGVPGSFDKAKSVAFDAFGNVYVVDSQQGYVQLFNAKHQPLMAFAGRAAMRGYMRVPTAIAITSRNTIFVADFAGNAVHEYQLMNTNAQDSFTPSSTPAAPAIPTGGGSAKPIPTGASGGSQNPQGG